MAKIHTTYTFDLCIGDRVRVNELTGTLRLIEGNPTPERGRARAWVDLDGGADSNYKYFWLITEGGEMRFFTLNVFEFLDVELIE